MAPSGSIPRSTVNPRPWSSDRLSNTLCCQISYPKTAGVRSALAEKNAQYTVEAARLETPQNNRLI